MTGTPLILFEPICRGSRLQILANMIGAVRAHSPRPIRIVTRSDYRSKHLAELMDRFAAQDVEFVPSDTDLNGAWIKILDHGELERLLRTLEAVVRGTRSADILFMALDDYLMAFARKAGWIARRFHACRISICKWRVEYLLPQRRSGWRSRALALLTHWAVRRTQARFICFDERLADRSIGRSPATVIPDPWFGEFSPARRHAARAKHGFGDDEFVILAVGKQDRRKGLPIILDALPTLLEGDKARLFVVGAIDQTLAARFARAARAHPGRIVHVDRFVDEAELPDVFAAADVFLLPYARDFTASSGTLPRAAASGVPVVTGRHGLVGHRVGTLGLGELFDGAEPTALGAAVRRVRAYRPDDLIRTRRALAAFAVDTSIESFASATRALFPEGTAAVHEGRSRHAAAPTRC